jgi:hypothetical protein
VVGSMAVYTVGGATKVGAVGRELEDAPAWMKVDRSSLSTMRCPVAIEKDGVQGGVGSDGLRC